ncbi:DUF4189 domain-containing protein [Nocardia sp. NPDC057353]|uniref:DUF4189 domain-containing protein n=1 Tax=Nocardia sp. NPDC057353 TaxID=3346104 RepID=UPI0036438233
MLLVGEGPLMEVRPVSLPPLSRSVAGVVATTAALLGAGVSAPAAAVPPKGLYYGTVSLSDSTGVVAITTDHRSYVAADAEAIKNCGVYDCRIVLQYTDGCAAVARGADGRFGWAAAPSLAEAEGAAVAGLGEVAPPFPDLGSAAPRPAGLVGSACTRNAS